MTQETRTSLLKAFLLMAVFSTVVTGAWISSTSNKPAPAAPKTTTETGAPTPTPAVEQPRDIIHYHIADDAESQQLGRILKSIVSPENGLAIVHFHLPGDPASEELADILNHIRKKYGRRVLVVRIGFGGIPVGLRAQGIDKLPHVRMIVGTKTVFEFQGLWSQQRVEQKVDEILHGLVKRVGKDWRPAVPGMIPAGK